MAASYSFSIVRLSSNDARDERLNVGLLVFKGDALDLRMSKRLDKVRSMSSAIDATVVRELMSNIAALNERIPDKELVAQLLNSGRLGALSLSASGNFSAQDEGVYETRVASLMRQLVDPEPSTQPSRSKRTRLFTNVRATLKRERLIALSGEDLGSHRIIPRYQLEDGLVADLVLRNGSMHVIETVDASGSEDQVRKAVSEIGVAALVLESARMKFGPKNTKTRIVYEASPSLEKVIKPALDAAENQGAELINWESQVDRGRFVHAMGALAVPVPLKRAPRSQIAQFGHA